ncbi:general odorant-binding protein 56a-like [Neocloeon triangulifer]|uniref:general odorant-binding protein 56a-like n=1 Tax=Neocloeon triangulifer TaxID=2078957 RepID=UPI00286F483E|nr:general odorant-binding protein 56a-like [Neocloeon triangulifer]
MFHSFLLGISIIFFLQIDGEGVNGIHMTRSMKFQQECAKNLGASKEESEKLKTVNFQYQYKCYMKCVAEKFEVMVDGKLNEPKIEEYLKRAAGGDETKLEEYKKSYETCKDRTDPDACETAGKLYECGKNTNSELLQELVTIISSEANADESKTE